MLEVNIILV